MPDADRRGLARPDAVAETILEMVRVAEALPNGARLEASAWSPPAAVRAAS
jgi:hypothetical protein